MDSSEPLLATKLVIPSLPDLWLARARLDFPPHHPRLVTLNAAAGYGKTSQMASWAQQSGRPVAWLTLDHEDNDPVRFLRHLVGAVKRLFPAFGDPVLRVLTADQSISMPRLLPILVNELCGLPEACRLMLDDLHAVDNAVVHAVLAYLVEHQPPGLGLVIASRHELPFSVSRLRAQRQLWEFHGEELRLNARELPQFCELLWPKGLDATQIAALDARTEGWIGGLQLALMAVEQAEDRSAFIDGFAGDDCHVTDFLADEILDGCPYSLLDFMLQTSVIDRFNPDLCDGLTGYADSRLMLDELVRRNLFVRSLDHRREWFCYHPLLLSYLRKKLREEQPRLAAELHRRACQWLHLQGLTQDAVNQSLQAQVLEQGLAPVAEIPVAQPEMEVRPPCDMTMRFSRKESQVARYILQGWNSQEIAETLCLSLSTIKTHTQNIYAKLGVNKRLHAIQSLQQYRWPDGKLFEAS